MEFDVSKLHALQRDLFRAIDQELAQDGHHKSYEGMFSVTCEWPNRFAYGDAAPETIGPTWWVTLHCYVIGPSRHYQWSGTTFNEAWERCEHSVREWIAQSDYFRHMDAEIMAEQENHDVERVHGEPPSKEIGW